MAAQHLNVMKTLVIGLGSSGTQICNALAERLQWELSDLSRAPWVRFLCIETNVNEPSVFHQSRDFRELRITKEEYSDLLANPRAYDEKIALSSWADMELLGRLPGKEVSVGAGNLRMVGRLSFLWQENFTRIFNAVMERLNALRDLQEIDATRALGQLPDGTVPEVYFAQSDAVRVVAVGTLCGGTCSGIVSDFGYFLKTSCQPQDKVTGVFTLPRHDLFSTTTDHAERYKRNAYQALVELNHYHLAGRTDEGRILFPNGTSPDTGTFPYDLVYLATPRKLGADGEQDLNRSVAERIFLNVMVPVTDPYARSVDESIIPRDGRAHHFSSFGLSTVEFPAYQVIEACSKRLLAHALRDWNGRQLASNQEKERVDALNLTWQGITEFLCQRANGTNLRQALNDKRDNILKLAEASAENAAAGVQQLRAAFGQWKGEEPGNVLPAGVVPNTLTENRYPAADMVVSRLAQDAKAHLLRYEAGPATMAQVVARAQDSLQKLQAYQPKPSPETAKHVDILLDEVRVLNSSPLVGFMGLRKRALRRLLPQLEEALNAEIRERLDAEVYRALHPRPASTGTEEGMLDRVGRLIHPIARRVMNLRARVTDLSETLDRRANELARMVPDINGKCIFTPETPGGSGGTVMEEYARCLQEETQDISRDWRVTRDGIAAQIIAQWTELPDSVTRDPRTREEDWLLQDLASARDRLVPADQQGRMETVARTPFRRLTREDVLLRWEKLDRAEMEARGVAQHSKPFLAISRPAAERNRSPIKTRKVLLSPATPGKERFVGAVRPGLDTGEDLIIGDSPDVFRAVLLEEWFNFPLTGATGVLGSGGIANAQCGDFPIFYTRRDVSWTSLSDAELAQLERAQALMAVAVLAGILEPKGSALTLPWHAGGFTSQADQERRLPLGLRQAAQMLASGAKDLDGRPLTGALTEVENRLNAQRKAAGDDKAFLAGLMEAWARGVGRTVPGWTDSAGEFLSRYCARDEALFQAYIEIIPPSPATIAQLRRTAGDIGPNGVRFESDGLYCPICGGSVGTDERDAARNGWRCYVNRAHYFGPEVGR